VCKLLFGMLLGSPRLLANGDEDLTGITDNSANGENDKRFSLGFACWKPSRKLPYGEVLPSGGSVGNGTLRDSRKGGI